MKLSRKLLLAAAFSLTAMMIIPTAQAEEYSVGKIRIENPWSREMPATSEVEGGFMTITNNGEQDDKLIKASGAISEVTQIHDMVMEGDVMKMKEVEGGLLIPAGQSVVLKPKSLHIMFMKLKNHPKAGDSFTGTLTFEKAGTVDISYKVDAMGAMH